MKKSVGQFTQAKLEELAQDDSNIVLSYADRAPLPESEILPLAEVHRIIDIIWIEFHKVKHKFWPQFTILTDLQRKKIRWYLLHKSTYKNELQKFSQTHPLMFNHFFYPNVTQKDVQCMHDMIKLKEQQQNGEISDGFEQLRSMVWNEFKRDEKDLENT